MATGCKRKWLDLGRPELARRAPDDHSIRPLLECFIAGGGGRRWLRQEASKAFQRRTHVPPNILRQQQINTYGFAGKLASVL